MIRRFSIVFFGPCRKLNPKTGDVYPAFSPDSRSGRYLRSIIGPDIVPSDVEIVFDNIISAPVFGSDGRERNPTVRELVEALRQHNLWHLDGANIIVGLSASVRTALETVQKHRDPHGSSAGPIMLFAEHPSFMMRRPRLERAEYASRVQNSIIDALRMVTGRECGIDAHIS